MACFHAPYVPFNCSIHVSGISSCCLFIASCLLLIVVCQHSTNTVSLNTCKNHGTMSAGFRRAHFAAGRPSAPVDCRYTKYGTQLSCVVLTGCLSCQCVSSTMNRCQSCVCTCPGSQRHSSAGRWRRACTAVGSPTFAQTLALLLCYCTQLRATHYKL